MELVLQVLLNGLLAGAAYSLVSLGFNLVFGTTRFLNMGHGAVAAVGGYAAFAITRMMHWPLLVGIIGAMICAGLVGWLIDRLVYSPLRIKKASSLVLVIASLGVMLVLQSLLAMLFSNQFWVLSSNSAWLDSVIPVGPAAISGLQILMLALSVLVFVVGGLFLKYSAIGRLVRAVGDDAEVAVLMGVPVERVIGGTVLVGSAVAGLAGVMVGLDIGIYPTMGLILLMAAATSSIIGGLGSVAGAFLGSYVLGLTENLGILFIPSGWKAAVSFGLMIIFLLFRPNGLLNIKK